MFLFYFCYQCRKERNIVEAASAGATSSIKMVGGIAVNVLAFLSILKMVNATLIWFGERAGVEGFTFQVKSIVY